MERLFEFLLQASLGIILFYMVYWFFLKRETFYNVNRFFLIGALIVSVILPVIPLRYTVFINTIPDSNFFSEANNISGNQNIEFEGSNGTSFSWMFIATIVYITGMVLFLVRILFQSFILFFLIVKNKIKSSEGINIVENDKYGLPFSFFNIVFINPKFHKQEGLPDILAHETVHIREKHWADLVIIELLTVIFWFNPFIWLFEHSIKQNHEYLADSGVISRGHSLGRYQALLINQLMGMQIIGFTNNLNFALNANRLKMMTKQKTPKRRVIKLVWILPAVAILVMAFAKPSYRSRVIDPEASMASIREFEEVKTINLVGQIFNENGLRMPGVSVVIKGTTAGTLTDEKGFFKIKASENDKLVLSFVGYKTFVTSVEEIRPGEVSDGLYNMQYMMEKVTIAIDPEIYSKDFQKPPPPPPPPIPEPVKSPGGDEVFYVVEEMPSYPGGPYALGSYIRKMAQKYKQVKNITGKAVVNFTVNAKGEVTNIEVIEKSSDKAAKGAYTIVSGMKPWNPGSQRGKPVSVDYSIPIDFDSV